MRINNIVGLIICVTNFITLTTIAQPLDQKSNCDSDFTKLGIPRRLISIDNKCAWPNLSVLKDGTIIATIYGQPNHGLTEGDAECWASVDEGLSWTYRGTPTRHDPKTNRMNVAAGINADGNLIVLCSGWDNINPRRNSSSKPIETSISISKDNGKTWEIGGKMPPAVKGLSHHVPFGDILVANNGDLVVGTYAFEVRDGKTPENKRKGNVYAVRSSDEGKTWNYVTPIAKGINVEAAMLNMGGGKWLAASRRFGYLDLEIHASYDDGFSWQSLGVLGIPDVSAANLLKLSDGRILLTYGNRSPGNRGIDIRVSENEGKTWSAPQRIIDLRESNDLGYPAAIQLPGGRIMVAYYSSGITQHNRYHMGVVNFLPNEIVVK